MNTYGIVLADITGRLPIVIDSNSRPTSTIVTSMISEAASWVNGSANAVGIDSDGVTDSTSITYNILRSAVIAKTCQEVLSAKNSGSEQALYYKEQFDSYMQQLRDLPRHVGDADGPNTVRTITYGSPAADLIDPVARKIIYGNTGFYRGRCALSTGNTGCC
jgi:hypothetical protein